MTAARTPESDWTDREHIINALTEQVLSAIYPVIWQLFDDLLRPEHEDDEDEDDEDENDDTEAIA
jgi:hypothetical protein